MLTSPSATRSFLRLLLAIYLGAWQMPVEGASGDIVENGSFRESEKGEIAGWTREGTVQRAPLPGKWEDAPAEALRIEDTGGMAQTLRGLSETQTYRLRFRAWRVGGRG